MQSLVERLVKILWSQKPEHIVSSFCPPRICYCQSVSFNEFRKCVIENYRKRCAIGLVVLSSSLEARYLFLRGEIILVVRKMRTTKRQASDIKGDISTFLVAIARRDLIDAADAENPARASWLCSTCDEPTVAGLLI
jgi:hypothetical protein